MKNGGGKREISIHKPAWKGTRQICLRFVLVLLMTWECYQKGTCHVGHQIFDFLQLTNKQPVLNPSAFVAHNFLSFFNIWEDARTYYIWKQTLLFFFVKSSKHQRLDTSIGDFLLKKLKKLLWLTRLVFF